MAICPYCKKYISATICQKYIDHMEVCKKWYVAERHIQTLEKKIEATKTDAPLREKLDALEKEIRAAKTDALFRTKETTPISWVKEQKPTQTTIFNITGNVVFGNQYQSTISTFYPQTKMIMDTALAQASCLPIDGFDTPEKLDLRMKEIQEANNKEMIKLLDGTDPAAKRQILTFLAEVMTIFGQRLRAEKPQSTVTIEAADDFKEECIRDQKLITSE